ncbi:hypothetical protein EJ06DRAFT_88566 [Trichodelitschia bisporula]|uniref:Uncharacterized protein n=1 Tax=Trichodelitschia bisporula TaxID=703511 RepID=A0A6G1HRY8_9PEZI|nr:hypothetical protein EJ06DRAFT_88566 [Trichodelitschia bisporula]
MGGCILHSWMKGPRHARYLLSLVWTLDLDWMLYIWHTTFVRIDWPTALEMTKPPMYKGIVGSRRSLRYPITLRISAIQSHSGHRRAPESRESPNSLGNASRRQRQGFSGQQTDQMAPKRSRNRAQKRRAGGQEEHEKAREDRPRSPRWSTDFKESSLSPWPN